jgi:hypothetical protein
MQLQQIDRIALQPLQALFQTLFDLSRDIAEPAGIEGKLGRQIRLIVDLAQQPAQRFLGLAFAVRWRGVDPVDAGIEGPTYSPAFSVIVLVNQQTADKTAAKYQLRYP